GPVFGIRQAGCTQGTGFPLPSGQRRGHPVGVISAFHRGLAGLAEPQGSVVTGRCPVGGLTRPQPPALGPAAKQPQRRSELLQVRGRAPFEVRQLVTTPPFDLRRRQPAHADQDVDRGDVPTSRQSRLAGSGDTLSELPLVVGTHCFFGLPTVPTPPEYPHSGPAATRRRPVGRPDISNSSSPGSSGCSRITMPGRVASSAGGPRHGAPDPAATAYRGRPAAGRCRPGNDSAPRCRCTLRPVGEVE